MKSLKFFALALLASLASCSVQPGVSGMTQDQAAAIIAELKDIKRVLVEQQRARAADTAVPAAAAAAAPSTVKLADVAVNVLGSASAPVTMVEFSDYQCPFCKRFHERTFPDLKKKYIDTGKVRYVVRDLPLPFHGEAMPAAIGVRCAGEQGQFWAVYEALFASQDMLSAQMVRKAAVTAGADGAVYDACIKKPTVKALIEAEMQEAERIGVTGTPGFVIAQKKGQELEGTLVLGSQATTVFTAKIDALLAGKPAP